MGLSDGGGEGGISPQLSYDKFFEETSMPWLKRKIEIDKATYCFVNDCHDHIKVKTQITFLDISLPLTSKFYEDNSPEAIKIAQKYGMA
jgi:hypothetical protein